MSDENTLSRRSLLMKIGTFFNGLVATALAVPIVGYVLSSLVQSRSSHYLSWVPLGQVNDFPEGETRLATFRNPNVMPSDGKTVDTACWVRRDRGQQFQVFAVNCAHLGCPGRWFPQSRLVHVPVSRRRVLPGWSRASGPPERGLFEYPFKVENGIVQIQAGELPTPGATLRRCQGYTEHRHAPDSPRSANGSTSDCSWPRRFAKPWSIPFRAIPRVGVYVFGSAALTVFMLQIVTGILLALVTCRRRRRRGTACRR